MFHPPLYKFFPNARAINRKVACIPHQEWRVNSSTVTVKGALDHTPGGKGACDRWRLYCLHPWEASTKSVVCASLLLRVLRSLIVLKRVLFFTNGCPRKKDTQISGAVIQKLLNLQKFSFKSLIFSQSLYKISQELIHQFSLSYIFSDEYWKPVWARVEFQISWWYINVLCVICPLGTLEE